MADDEQFSLCWNNFNTNLSAGFHESLCRGDLVDVTLAAEGQLVKAHRLVLSVCSPYFRKMFTQMPANQHAFVFLKDVSHSALKDLIQFMYCGEVNVKQDALPAFISTAEALQIKGLTENGDGPSGQAPHPSPAKESTVVHSTPAPPPTGVSPRGGGGGHKIVQRARVQSYKIESEESSDEKAQTVHVQPTPVAQKRTMARTVTPASTPVLKRAKITTTADPLEASEPTVQTIQIVKNVPSSEPEYVEMPIETINPKSEPEYVEDSAVMEGTEQEHDETETHEIHETEEGQYVEDESYGDMKYDESYFTEGDDTKAGASGFGESYAEGADQSASEAQGTSKKAQPDDANSLKQLLKKQMESIDWLKKKNRRLENSLSNMEKANTEFQMKALSDIKVEKGWEEIGSDSFSCNDDSSFAGESSRQADDLQPIFQQFDKIPRSSGSEQQNTKQRYRRKLYPDVAYRFCDGLQSEPQFYTDPNVPEITAQDLTRIHQRIGSNIEKDIEFVYEVMRHIFKDLLEVQSLKGSIVVNSFTGEAERINALDKCKLNYVYEQYQIRVMAVGLNVEERTKRAQEKIFRKYVISLTNCEHTRKAYREKQLTAQLLHQ